jgi:hypothetical protein
LDLGRVAVAFEEAVGVAVTAVRGPLSPPSGATTQEELGSGGELLI